MFDHLNLKKEIYAFWTKHHTIISDNYFNFISNKDRENIIYHIERYFGNRITHRDRGDAARFAFFELDGLKFRIDYDKELEYEDDGVLMSFYPDRNFVKFRLNEQHTSEGRWISNEGITNRYDVEIPESILDYTEDLFVLIRMVQ